MNFSEQKSTSFLLILLPCFCISNAIEVIKTSIGPNRPIQVGETVRLTCKSDSAYEYCIWRHKNRVCNFEWKSSHGDVKKQTCTELNNRAHFRGSYSNNECSIDLENVQLTDQGAWSCEVERYVWGPARGSVHKKSLSLNVIPKITTTLITTPKSSDQPTESSTKEAPSTSVASVLDGQSTENEVHEEKESTSIIVGASTSRSDDDSSSSSK